MICMHQQFKRTIENIAVALEYAPQRLEDDWPPKPRRGITTKAVEDELRRMTEGPESFFEYWDTDRFEDIKKQELVHEAKYRTERWRLNATYWAGQLNFFDISMHAYQLRWDINAMLLRGRLVEQKFSALMAFKAFEGPRDCIPLCDGCKKGRSTPPDALFPMVDTDFS